MHYKNGREIKIGEMVIGRTHNSQQRLRIGRVKKLMPQQGPCNVELFIIGNDGSHFLGSETLRTIRTYEKDKEAIEVAVDYADAKDLYRLDDAYRAINAVYCHALHNSPYSETKEVE